MSRIVQIGYNPVTAKIFRGTDKSKLLTSTVVSYYVDGYEHMQAFQSKSWNGMSSFYDWEKDTFPRGFVEMVEAELRGKGYTVQIVSKDTPPPLGPEKPVVDSFGYIPRYDYQWETVEQLVNRGQMIARVATGGGKSRIAKMAHARIGRPTLFITTRKQLMYQMKRSFEAAGWKCGVLGDSLWEPNDMLNVAMVPTLMSRLTEPEPKDKSLEADRQRRLRKETIEFLGKVEFLIGEEAHESGSDSYFDALKHCRKAAYRLALTATPFMRASAEDNMRLQASFGGIGIEVSEKLLIDRGILARPIFQYVDIEPPRKLRKTTPWQRAVELGIVENEARNADIVRRTVEAAEHGLTTIALVTRKTHGAKLRDQMREAGLRVVFIFGETDQEKRDKALKLLEEGKLDCLIGSTILDVGVDVPAVGQIILAGGGKAEVALRQRIGRGLREKKVGPNVCLVVDYKDRGNKHLQSHALSRQQIVNETPGFKENILPLGRGFDFGALGFTKTRTIAPCLV